MGCVKRNLIIAVLTLFLVSPAIPTISHAQGTVPIAGAKVSFEGPSSGFVTTDVNGRYIIAEGLESGVYSIVVTAPGYIDAKLENIKVTVGKENPNINIFLKRSGAISGVLNATRWWTHLFPGCCPPPTVELGEIGALITATQTAGTGGNLSSYALCGKRGSGYTAFLGLVTDYTIYTGLTTGTYKVTAELDGYVSCTLDNVMVREAQETPNVNITIEPAGLMSGMVVTSAGMPLSRALVTAHSSSYSGAAYTNSTGHYSITKGLGTDTYNVFVKYKTYSSSRPNVKIASEFETPGVIFRLDIPSSGSIIGKLTDGKGNAIKNALVRAGQVEARTDEGGYYSILIGAGDYTVSASASGFYPSSSTRAIVSVNQQTQINFDLKRVSGVDSAKISGQVTGQANPIPEFQVNAIPIIYALPILVVLLASRKIRRTEGWTRSPK